MRVEVINTGSELLRGQVINTHLAYLAQSLFTLGLRVERQVTVPDGAAIGAAVTEARGRGGLILITGGLGPTSDDISREEVSRVANRPLIFHPEILEEIAEKFRRHGSPLNELQRSQAMVLEGALVLPNAHGTAPGLLLEETEIVTVLLPGPPRELRPMWENEVLPWLKTKLKTPPRHELILRTLGLGESRVQLLLEQELRALASPAPDELEIGYCARPHEVDLRLSSPDGALLQRAAELARTKLGEAVYAEGAETMEAAVVRLARAARLTVATAESCTGGSVAAKLTQVPGCSEIFRYGWVTYADEAKIRELGVPKELVATHGAVSESVARAMAEGALAASGADLAVSVTGVAGPGGGTQEKPVGLVWFAVARRNGPTFSFSKKLVAERVIWKNTAAQVALDAVRRVLVGW